MLGEEGWSTVERLGGVLMFGALLLEEKGRAAEGLGWRGGQKGN